MSKSTKASTRTDHIVHAAGQLFAQQGYHGTTTRQIAQLADVSENTLFRHFDTKEDMFWAALRGQLADLKLRRTLFSAIAAGRAPDVVVPELVDMLIETVIFRPQLLRLMAVAYLELGWKAAMVCNEQVTPVFTMLGEYFQSSIDAGTMRNLDPSMLIAALGMTVMIHPELSRMLRGGPPPHADRREAVQAYTKFWMDVVAPPSRVLRQSPA